MSLQVEESISYAQLLTLLDHRDLDVRWGQAYSTGTRVWVKHGGVWSAYLVTDLTAPKKVVLVALGRVSISLGAGVRAAAVIAVQNLGLPVTNFRAFTSLGQITAGVIGANEGYFTEYNLIGAFGGELLIQLYRTPETWTPSGSTVSPEPDTGHTHTVTGMTFGGAVTFDVDWLVTSV